MLGVCPLIYFQGELLWEPLQSPFWAFLDFHESCCTAVTSRDRVMGNLSPWSSCNRPCHHPWRLGGQELTICCYSPGHDFAKPYLNAMQKLSLSLTFHKERSVPFSLEILTECDSLISCFLSANYMLDIVLGAVDITVNRTDEGKPDGALVW